MIAAMGDDVSPQDVQNLVAIECSGQLINNTQ